MTRRNQHNKMNEFVAACRGCMDMLFITIQDDGSFTGASYIEFVDEDGYECQTWYCEACFSGVARTINKYEVIENVMDETT